ncbi:cupin domain-containing protein, partial [Streptomyces microflavus]|uniref:cupin domain-containing protein n=1 Tax=Streptomyces microflavus TaxID=1919 RepID=UPI0036B71D1E
MDVFDELLRGVRGKGAVFGRSVLWPPWSLRFTDGAYLTLCLPMRGAGWIVPEGGEPRRLAFGEAAIVRGPAPFTFTDDPANGTGTTVPGTAPGVREVRWGDDLAPPDGHGSELAGPTVLLAAAYDVQAEVPLRLLRALPPGGGGGRPGGGGGRPAPPHTHTHPRAAPAPHQNRPER